MAEPELEKLIEDVNNSKNGAEIRTPLVNLFRYLLKEGSDAATLNLLTVNDLAKQKDMERLIPFDDWKKPPEKDSQKLVPASVIYSVTGDLNRLQEQIDLILKEGI